MSKRYSQKQAAARVVREQIAREQRRRTQIWTALGVVFALVVAGAGGWLLYTSQNDGKYNTPKGMYKDDSGIVVGTGPTVVEVYLDFLCPICRNFENQSKDTVDQMVAENKIKMVYHPVAILDHQSTNKFPTRAAAASACAADEGKFQAYAQAVYANQPAEGGAGPEDSELIATGRTIGLGDSFATCVKDGTYLDWTKHTTELLAKRAKAATPTMFIDGKQVDATVQSIIDAVTKADK